MWHIPSYQYRAQLPYVSPWGAQGRRRSTGEAQEHRGGAGAQGRRRSTGEALEHRECASESHLWLRKDAFEHHTAAPRDRWTTEICSLNFWREQFRYLQDMSLMFYLRMEKHGNQAAVGDGRRQVVGGEKEEEGRRSWTWEGLMFLPHIPIYPHPASLALCLEDHDCSHFRFQFHLSHMQSCTVHLCTERHFHSVPELCLKGKT